MDFLDTLLKGIPSILNPDLIHALASMGHGDQIVLADANFPAASIAKEGCNSCPLLITSDGENIPELLDAILKLMPLETQDENSVRFHDSYRKYQLLLSRCV